MSSNIDERVVKMTFDNKEFEKNIKTTSDSLSDFEKKLKFDGAAAGFEQLNKAADKVDFSSMAESAEEAVNGIEDAANSLNLSNISDEANNASDGFSVFEEIAVGALRRVGETVSDFVTNKLSLIGNAVKGLTIDPIFQGFDEYQQQITSIQTILANTGGDFDSQVDIDEVNAALDALNEYADLTIYNFNDMVNAIGRFTAAGIGRDNLQEAVDTVKGVANTAALLGADSSQVSRVYPQIAQALSSGFVSMVDWFSMETAGMNGKAFTDLIANLAVHWYESGYADDRAWSAGNYLLNGGNMRSALNKADHKDWGGWLTSEMLSEAFQMLTYDTDSMSEEEYEAVKNRLAQFGYTEEEMKEVFDMAEQAKRAATEVKTLSQLIDTLSEGIGSNWSQFWRNFIGDFKQATDTFTFIKDTLETGINALFSGINRFGEAFKDSGAAKIIFGGFLRDEETGGKVYDEVTQSFVRVEGALDHFIQAITKPLGAVADAWNTIFGKDYTNPEVMDEYCTGLVEMAMNIDNFAQSLIISDDAATGVRQIFEGLFAILDVGLTVLGDVAVVILDVVDAIRVLSDPLTDIVLSLGGQVGKVIVWIHDKFMETRDALIDAVEPFHNAFEVIKDIARAFFDWLNIPDLINAAGDGLIDLLEIIWDFIDIPGIIRDVGEAFSWIFDGIADITGWSDAVQIVNEVFEQTGQELNVIDVWFDLLMSKPIPRFFKDTADAIGGVLESIGGFMSRIGDFILESGPIQTLGSIFDGFKNGAVNFFLGLPDRFSKMKASLDESLGNLGVSFDGWFQWFEDVSNYFDTVTVEQFINDVQTKFSEFQTTLSNVFDHLVNLTPEQLSSDFISLVDTVSTGVYNALSIGATAIESGFPELNGSLTNGLDEAYKSIQLGIGNIKAFIDPIAAESENIPDFVFKLFVRTAAAIKNAVETKFNEVVTYLQTLTPESLVNDVTSGFENILNSVYGVLSGGAQEIEKSFPELNSSLTQWLEDTRTNIETGVDNIRSFLDPILEKSETFPEFFTNLFEAIGKAIEDGLGTRVTEAFEHIRNLTPEQLVTDITSVADNVATSIHDTLYSGAKEIEKSFPELNGSLTSGLDEAYLAVEGGIGNIKAFLDPIVAESETMPEFFYNLILAIGDSIGKAFDETIHTIQEFSPDDILEPWTNISDKIRTVLDTFFPNLTPTVTSALNTVTSFIMDVTSNTESWGDVLQNIFDKIGEYFTNFPITFEGIIGGIGTAISEAILAITGVLSNISGPFGEFFGMVHNKVDEIGNLLSEGSESFPDKFMKMFGGVKEPAGEATNSISGVWTALNQGDKSGESHFSIFDNIVVSLKTSFDTFFSTIRSIIDFESVGKFFSDKFGWLKETLTNLFEEDTWNKLVTVVEGILAGKLIFAISGFIKDLGSTTKDAGGVFKSVSGLIDQVSKKVKDQDKEKFTDKVLKITESIAILAGSLWVVSTIEKPDEVLATLGKLELIVTAMIAVVGVLNKFNLTAGDEMEKTAKSMSLFAVGMLALMEAIDIMNDFDWEGNKKGREIAEDMMFLMGTIAALISRFGGDGGSNMVQIAAGMSILMLTIQNIIPVIQAFQEFVDGIPADKMESTNYALLLLAGSMITIGVSLGQAGDHAIGAALAFNIVMIAISSLIEGIKELNSLKLPELITSFAGLAVIIGEFAYLANKCKNADLVVTALSVVVFSSAIVELSAAVNLLAENKDWTQIAAAGVVLAGLIGVFAALATLTKEHDLIVTAAALVIFGASVGELAVSLYALNNLNPDTMDKSAASLAGLIAVFFALVKLTKECDLIATAGALVIFGLSVGELAISLYALNDLKSDMIVTTTVALSSLVGVFALLAAITKETDLIATSAALVIFGLAVGELSLSLYALNDLNPDNLTATALALDSLIFVFGLMAAITQESDLIASAAALTIFGIAVAELSVSLMLLEDLDYETIGSGILCIDSLIAVLALLSAITKECDLIATSSSLVIFGAAIVEMTVGMNMLTDLDIDSMSSATLCISGLIGVFGLLTKLTDGIDIVATGSSLILFGAAVVELSIGLGSLSGIDTASVGAATLCITELIAVFGLLAGLTGGIDLIATSSSLVIFGAAVVELSIGLGSLSGIDTASVGAATLCITELIAVFGILAGLTLGIDLIATAGSLVVFGLSIIELATALTSLSGIDTESVSSATLCISGLLAVLLLLTDFTNAVDLIATGLALIEFGAAICIIAEGITLFGESIKNMPSLEEVKDAGYNLIAGLGEGIVAGVGHIIEVLAGVWNTIVKSIKDFFGINSPSTLMRDEIGQYLPAGIAEGILGGEGDITTSLDSLTNGILENLGGSLGENGILNTNISSMMDGMCDNALSKLGESLGDGGVISTNLNDMIGGLVDTGLGTLGEKLEGLPEWIETEGIPKLQEMAGKIWDWWTTEGWPKVQEITPQILESLGKLLEEFWKWFNEEGLPALGDAVGKAWDWFIKEGLPKLGEFGLEILKGLGDLLSKFWKWFQEEGLPALGDAIGKAWDWFITEGLPKIGEFLTKILEKIGELPGKLLVWVQTDGAKMIEDAIHGIMDEADKIKDKIIEWAKKIPDHIGEGIKQIWDDLCKTGDDIAKGISDGIDSGKDWIVNAVTGMGETALQAIKNFFGIQSPSKVMRDEVGKYIDEGLAIGIGKYSNVASDAGANVGLVTMKSIMESVEEAVKDDALPQPVITPVIGSIDYTYSTEDYNNMVAAAIRNDPLEVKGNISTTLDSTNFDTMANLVSKRLAEQIDNDNYMKQNITEQLENIRNDFVNIIKTTVIPKLDSMDATNRGILDGTTRMASNEQSVYIDGDALVGTISARMDSALGYRQIMASRGV